MRRGTPKGEFGAVVARMAPKLDATINCTTEVNAARAGQSGSIATPTEKPQPSGIRPLSRAEVMATSRRRGKDKSPPEVNLSLFVQISQDLSPEARRAVREQIGKLSVRARWKLDTAVVEVRGPRVRELHAVDEVSYMEPGQTLREPEPIVGAEGTAPTRGLRRVSAHAKEHGDGRGVLVGIIDVGGFDFAHEDFLDGDRCTRWEAIWDQGGVAREDPYTRRRKDERFASLDYGSEIQKEDMDRAIVAAGQRHMAATSLEPQSVMQVGSHGTHVASIAGGNLGVARQARLAGVLVALRPEDRKATSSFYDSTRIAHAVDYLLAVAADLGGKHGPLPVAINISLGTNGHAHDTSSAMARWIDNALSTPGRSVTVAAGNAGQVEAAVPPDGRPLTGRIHAAGSFAGTGLRHVLRWVVAGGEVADVSENEMEIWYGAQDRISVEVRPPGGSWIGPVEPGGSLRNVLLDNGTYLNVHSETYYPANGANRIWIVLAPFYGDEAGGVRGIGPIAAGEWEVRLTGTTIRDGRYDAWIERDDARRVPGPDGRSWRYPSTFAPGSYTDDRMISSLACAERILSVANVDAARSVAHVSSSRGPTRDGRPKPDVGADGTDVVAARGFDSRRPWIAMTGTSMASPYVCGAAALMLAIEPRLTAAQIQGIVISTSQPLPGHSFSWRNDTGFGLIDPDACVEEAMLWSKRGRL